MCSHCKEQNKGGMPKKAKKGRKARNVQDDVNPSHQEKSFNPTCVPHLRGHSSQVEFQLIWGYAARRQVGPTPYHLGKTAELTSEQKTKLASHFHFGEDADPVWKSNFVQQLLGYANAFSQAEFDIGEVDFEHDIELDPGPCIWDRPRPVPQYAEELQQHSQSLLDANIIKPSVSHMLASLC